MKRIAIFIALLSCVASNSRAQTASDSSAVMKATLLHYVESAEPARIGVVLTPFTPNTIVNGRGTGFRWNMDKRPDAMPAAIAANSRLRAVPVFDSITRECPESGRGLPDANRRRMCWYRDFDAVVSISNPEFQGQSASMLVRQDRSISGMRTPISLIMWRYDLELRSGRWVVVKVTLLAQS